MTNPEAAGNGKPLDGVRILAIEQMQSLPYATQLMARMGADVVKIEHATRGDLGRGSTPAVVDENGQPMGATFIRNNLSKRSVGLDLKDHRARRLVERLVPRFDVFAENLRPGAIEGMGLGYEEVARIDRAVVYLSVSGFGHLAESPYREWPAFASIAEAMSGLYTFNRAADEPLKVSPAGALGDTGSALFAVIGVLSALRQRDRTGEGQYVDIAMLDAMIAFADVVPSYWSLGQDPRAPTMIINDAFAIESGELVIQVGREHQFERLCELIGRPQWPDDERFSTRAGWRENLDEIRAAVREWAGSRSSVDVAGALAGAGIAAGPVFEASDLARDQHVEARAMYVELEVSGREHPVLVPGNPVKMSAVSEGPDTPPPALGRDTDSVLRSELGIDDEELARLRDDGVIT